MCLGYAASWGLITVFIKQGLCLYKFLELLRRREVKDQLTLLINCVLLFLQYRPLAEFSYANEFSPNHQVESFYLYSPLLFFLTLPPLCHLLPTSRFLPFSPTKQTSRHSTYRVLNVNMSGCSKFSEDCITGLKWATIWTCPYHLWRFKTCD